MYSCHYQRCCWLCMEALDGAQVHPHHCEWVHEARSEMMMKLNFVFTDTQEYGFPQHDQHSLLQALPTRGQKHNVHMPPEYYWSHAGPSMCNIYLYCVLYICGSMKSICFLEVEQVICSYCSLEITSCRQTTELVLQNKKPPVMSFCLERAAQSPVQRKRQG